MTRIGLFENLLRKGKESFISPVNYYYYNNYSTVVTESVSVQNTRDFNEIPGPKRLPLLGNTYLYKLGKYNYLDYHNILKKLYSEYGPVVREDIGGRTVIHVFDPDDVKRVHSVEGKTPEIPPLQETTQLYREQRGMSLGLGNTNGEEWYKLRSAVQQMMMRPKEVHHYLPLQDSVSQDFVTKIEQCLDENNVSPDLRMLVAKWTMESAGMICFEKRLGYFDINEELGDQMVDANKEIFYLSGLMKFSFPLFKYLTTPTWKKFLKAEDFFYLTASNYIENAMLEIVDLMKKGELESGRFNFLSYLLSRKELSRKDVKIITQSLFGDGLSTTTPTLMYCLYCIAKNSNAQDKIFEEVKIHVSPTHNITVNNLNNLQYLKAAVKETMRIYPIGTEVSRITNVDLVLGGYKVPTGTHVDMNQSVHFCSPAYFTDPDSFIPERWLRENQKSLETNDQSLHPYLFTPFGHGTRMCAGRRFAEQDLYTSVARIIQRFKLELINPSDSMDQVYHTLLFPKYPLRLRFIRR